MPLRSQSIAAMNREFQKLAVEDEEANQQDAMEPVDVKKPQHPALTAAKYLGGYGAGTLAGYGGMQAGQAISKALRKGKPMVGKGSVLMHAVPAMAGLGGLAFTHAQNTMFDRMREDSVKRRGGGG